LKNKFNISRKNYGMEINQSWEDRSIMGRYRSKNNKCRFSAEILWNDGNINFNRQFFFL